MPQFVGDLFQIHEVQRTTLNEFWVKYPYHIGRSPPARMGISCGMPEWVFRFLLLEMPICMEKRERDV